jgi:hypothetical protein
MEALSEESVAGTVASASRPLLTRTSSLDFYAYLLLSVKLSGASF